MTKGYVYSSKDIHTNTTNGYLIDVFPTYNKGNIGALEYRKKYNWPNIWLSNHTKYCSHGTPAWHLGET